MAEFQPDPNRPLRVVGRYALYGRLATGGMATVHFGRLLGPVGFSRTVAIKRLHPQFAKDPEFVAMFLDEARLAARIQHPNVVATVDVVAMDEELFLVMDYVRGESFSRLLRGARRKSLAVPMSFVSNVVASMLHGLHAAHEAVDERGQPLKVVHRDVSPQNVLVGVDGVARVLDFGVAKAAARIQVTRDGQMKGKLSYMSPEQLSGRGVDRRSDVFAAGVVLWEALTGERLFTGDDASEVLTKILQSDVAAPSTLRSKLTEDIDRVVLRALAKDPDARYQTAREFAIALESAIPLMSPREVGEWVELIAGENLEKREQALAEIESVSSVNELTALTPSDPGFMKTLRTQVRGRQAPPRPLPGDGGAPFTSGNPAAVSSSSMVPPEELPTTVYHAPPGAPLDLVPPRTSSLESSQLEDPGTDPGRTQLVNPFREQRPWVPYVAWAGVGCAVAALLYFGYSLTSLSSETPKLEPTQRVTPTPSVIAAPPEPIPTAIDVMELPKEDISEEERATSNRSKVSSRPRTAAAGTRSQRGATNAEAVERKPGMSKKPTDGRPDCAQPWVVDKDGIRRIKPGCL